MFRRHRTLSCILVSSVCPLLTTTADLIHVPADFGTIQEAIDAAVDGDVVAVSDGTYAGAGNTNLDFGGRLITVRSESDNPARCIIDCAGVEGVRGFYFHSDETDQAVVRGFTIQRGVLGHNQDGGGMLMFNGSPTVINCAFRGNRAPDGVGGGLAALRGSPTVTGCTFTGNSAADGFGGGGMCVGDRTTVIGCTFTENSAGGETGSRGGGLAAYDYAMVTNCSFTGNRAEKGGGMYISLSATVADCTFVGNRALRGGGMHAGVSATVTDCTFSHNRAGRGGGMCLNDSATVTDCTFIENIAGNEYEGFGGGMDICSGSPTVDRCTFIGNTVPSAGDMEGALGGGMSVWGRSPTVADCIFRGNAAGRGGGMSVASTHTATVMNCSFTGNEALLGGGMSVWGHAGVTVNCSFSANAAARDGGGMWCAAGSSTTAVNCVLWGNESTGGSTEISGEVAVTYSIVGGGYEGAGNIDADPLFTRMPHPGADGEWGTEDDDHGDLHLTSGSPAIDAGDNTTVPPGIAADLDGNQRFVDDPDTEDTGVGGCPVVDRGVYEFQAEGGCCLRDPQWICDGDVDGDGQVNPVDSGLVQAAFGSAEESDLCQYDVDCDGQINPVDAGIVQSLFGTCELPREVCP